EPLGNTLVVAVVQYPSKYSHNSTDYKGPILFNPGGPGGSGVDFVLGRGKTFGDIFDGRFDIVGLIPVVRIARSTRVSVFRTEVERALWGYDLNSELGYSPDGVGKAWATASVTGELALERDNGLLAHINTDQTARDMLRITEAYGYEKLQYWGFSYGTVLGATFAAMLPDKVGRIIIDGVCDSEDYYATLWSKNLVDSEKTLQGFFDGCYEAGPQRCSFYAPSPDAISANLTALYKRLRTAPVPVKTDSGYGVLDYRRLRRAVFLSLYSPYAKFPILADALSELARGSGNLLYNMTREPDVKCSCPDSSNELASVNEATMFVACNDGASVPNNLTEIEEYYAEISSEYDFGSLWAGLRIGCSGWPRLPKDHFQGPFVTNTSHPVLLIGNTADPVTPLCAAQKMSAGFKDSVVVHQDSLGHCSLAAASPCTLGYVRGYFINGTLPKAGTVCPTIDKLFFPPEKAEVHEQTVWSYDDRMSKLGRELRSLSAERGNGPLQV
ncbi:TAP-like protein-domain-containing protein, partial [Mucidula mucida]